MLFEQEQAHVGLCCWGCLVILDQTPRPVGDVAAFGERIGEDVMQVAMDRFVLAHRQDHVPHTGVGWQIPIVDGGGGGGLFAAIARLICARYCE